MYFRKNKVSGPPVGLGGTWRKDEMDMKFTMRKKVWTGLESGEENRIDRSKPLTPTVTHPPVKSAVFGGKVDKCNQQQTKIGGPTQSGGRPEPSEFPFNYKDSRKKKLTTDQFLRYSFYIF